MPAVTIGEQLLSCVRNKGDALFGKQKRGGEWHDISWNKYYEEINEVGLALVSQGFQPHQVVYVMLSVC